MSLINLQTVYKQYSRNPNTNFKDVILEQKHMAMIELSSLLRISNTTIFQNDLSITSFLAITTSSSLNNFIGEKNLYVYGIFNNNINCTINNRLYNTGNSSITSNLNTNILTVTDRINANALYITSLNILNNLYVNANSYINYLITTNGFFNLTNILNNIYVKNYINNGNISCDTLLYSLSNSVFNNNLTVISNLYLSNDNIINNLSAINIVSDKIKLENNTTINNNVNCQNFSVDKSSIISQGGTVINDLYVSNTSTIKNLNILDNIVLNLENYPNNTTAAANNIPYYGLYRTGDIVKVRLDVEIPIITLNGSSTISILRGSVYEELGVSWINSNDPITLIITGTVDINTPGTYNLSYYCTDILNNISNILNRVVIVI